MKEIVRCLHKLSPHKSRLIVILTPVLLSPLLIIFQGTKEIRCLYTIILMSIFWLTEAAPLAVTALLPLVLYPMLGISKAKDVAKDYMKDPLFLFVGGYFLAIAVEECNLHKRLALGTLMVVGSNIKKILMSLMLSTGFLSMWASNAACTAMMLPIIQAILAEIIKDSRLHSSTESTQDLQKSEDPATETQIGTAENPTLLGIKLNKKEHEICKMMLLGICYSSNIGGIGTLTGTPPNIIVFGMIEASYGTNTGLTYATWMLAAMPLVAVNLILAWIILQVFFLGFRETFNFCGSNNNNDMDARNVIKLHYDSLGPMSYKEKLVSILFLILILLWIFRSPKFVAGWGDLFPNEYVSDSTAAIFIAFLLFVLPAEPLDCLSNDSESKSKNHSRSILSWKVLQNKFPWDMLLLIGGSFGMAEGVKKSGLADLVGYYLSKMNNLSIRGMCAVTALITTFLTEVTSNAAAIIILTPILQAVAVNLRVNPLYLILTSTICVSYAFMLPVATVPNAIVFGAGLLRVVDMAKVGFVMNCVTVAVTLFGMNTWGWALFHFGSYPSWAPSINVTTGHNSTFVMK